VSGKREEQGVPARREHGMGGVCTARSGPGLCTCRNESTCVVRACRRNLEKQKYDKWHFQTKRR